MTGMDPEDPDSVAATFGIAPALAREIVWENDEGGLWMDDPEKRFRRMRSWCERMLSGGKP